MKIVTRLVDILEGGLNPTDTMNKYAVYLQIDGISIACDLAYGEMEREATEDALKWSLGGNVPMELGLSSELEESPWAQSTIERLEKERGI